ncbi:MAG TPA: hypothetical protein VMQ81_05190 [Acidimicrobiia bacterium]|nr:hypothetical protein [Acidimicrobiia bacterium]
MNQKDGGSLLTAQGRHRRIKSGLKRRFTLPTLSVCRRIDRVSPLNLARRCRLSDTEQISAEVAHPVESITVLPRPRQRIGGGLSADDWSKPRDQRLPQRRLNRREHLSERFLVHHMKSLTSVEVCDSTAQIRRSALSPSYAIRAERALEITPGSCGLASADRRI